MTPRPIPMRVRGAGHPADRVLELELESTVGLPLPAWSPGAHVEVWLPSGLIRHYSLCGSPADDSSYRIAVLRETAGRGGSVELHERVRPGDIITVGPPRNSFELVEAPRYQFIAGGIGITPLLPMVEHAAALDVPWHLLYAGATRAGMAYTQELRDRYGAAVEIVSDDVEGRPDFSAVIARAVPDTAVYACGPGPLLDHLQELVEQAERPVDLHTERFTAQSVDTSGDPFDVELARSGLTLHVGPDQTVLEAMRAKGIPTTASCEDGYCGTCEAIVLDGEPDHRDTFLTDDERHDSFTMMICVSRCNGDRLVLDL